MQIRDDAGTEISSKICNIIGADGGSMPYARDHPWPSYGMLTDVAYRWDVVCDFSAYTGRVRSCLLCACLCIDVSPSRQLIAGCFSAFLAVISDAAASAAVKCFLYVAQ